MNFFYIKYEVFSTNFLDLISSSRKASGSSFGLVQTSASGVRRRRQHHCVAPAPPSVARASPLSSSSSVLVQWQAAPPRIHGTPLSCCPCPVFLPRLHDCLLLAPSLCVRLMPPCMAPQMGNGLFFVESAAVPSLVNNRPHNRNLTASLLAPVCASNLPSCRLLQWRWTRGRWGRRLRFGDANRRWIQLAGARRRCLGRGRKGDGIRRTGEGRWTRAV